MKYQCYSSDMKVPNNKKTALIWLYLSLFMEAQKTLVFSYLEFEHLFIRSASLGCVVLWIEADKQYLTASNWLVTSICEGTLWNVLQCLQGSQCPCLSRRGLQFCPLNFEKNFPKKVSCGHLQLISRMPKLYIDTSH